MNGITQRVDLSLIQVRWSDAESALIASSGQYPGLTHVDRWSSVAAMEGLVAAIERLHGSVP